MFKGLICISIIILSSLLGFSYGERYKKRVYILKDLQRGILQLENEIMYSYTPLPEALLKVSKKSNKAVSDLFKSIGASLMKNEYDSVYVTFKAVYNFYRESMYLTESDELIISDLFKSLGEVDILGHEKIFTLFLQSIKGSIDDAEELMKKNLKMYRYLGVCMGFGIVILIV